MSRKHHEQTPDEFTITPSVLSDEPQINLEQRMNAKQVAALFDIGVSTVWKFSNDGRLPKPEKYGSRCSRWRYGDFFRKQS